MGKALCFGSLNIDYVYDVPHFITEGETMASFRRSVYPGGKGLNQSIALSRGGMKTYHAGLIGPDGQILLDTLRAAEVDTSFVKQADEPSGHTVIQRDPSGLNAILLYGGTNRQISGEHIEEVLGNFAAGDYIILQNEINNIGVIMIKAKQIGMKIVFNPSPITEELLSYPLHLVDYFILNENEAEMLSDKTVPKDMLSALKIKYPSASIVLTLGKQGVCYTDPSLQEPVSHGVYNVQVVDTTAAGDTFTGYFISGISSGNDPSRALELASKASSIAVSRYGASPSIPRLEEVRNSALKF
jgi:ribokinase